MTDTMDERVKAIRSRAEAATPGPWSFDSYNSITETGKGPDFKIIAQILDHPQDDGPYESEQVAERSAWYRESSDNAHFIAHTRADIPWLLDLIDSQQKRIATLTDFARDIMDEWWDRSLDGCDLQEIGAKHGLLEAYDAPADNDCLCEVGEAHTCYRFNAIIAARVRAEERK